jgi:F-type H+-transporting ATPase subunit b
MRTLFSFRLLGPAVAMLVLAAVPALASEGGGAGSSLIQPKFGTIVWTFVTFLALAVVLGRFAWKPLLGALDARERSIQGSIDQARQDREQAESLLEQHKELLAEAHRERASARSEGQQDAERLKEEILEEARKQRESLLRQTEEQMQAGLRQARSELRAVAADLAIQAAGKLLARNLDDSAQRRLVEEYLADLERSAEPGSPPS